MPTGYTAPIEEGNGITFREFALRCAKAFGACVSLREDPMDKAIPEKFEPHDYNLKRLREAEARLCELNGTTEAQAEKMARTEWESAEKHRKESLAKALAVEARYAAMLTQVKAWKPPTPDHTELKTFMVQQIEICMRPSGMADYYTKETPLLSGTAWLAAKKAKTREDIAYHAKEWREEQERAASRTEWVRQLRESLHEKRREVW